MKLKKKRKTVRFGQEQSLIKMALPAEPLFQPTITVFLQDSLTATL
jgi:hypothetical protein